MLLYNHMKQKLLHKEIEAIDTQLKTFKGFRVCVGSKRNCGWFVYVKGNRKKALEVGKEMKKTELVYHLKKVVVSIEPCELKKCSMLNCNNLIEADERYCLKCENLLYEAQDIQKEQLRGIKI